MRKKPIADELIENLLDARVSSGRASIILCDVLWHWPGIANVAANDAINLRWLSLIPIILPMIR